METRDRWTAFVVPGKQQCRSGVFIQSCAAANSLPEDQLLSVQQSQGLLLDVVSAAIERQVAALHELVLLVVASRAIDAGVHADELLRCEELHFSFPRLLQKVICMSVSVRQDG